MTELLIQADYFKDETTGKFNGEGFKRFLDNQGYTEATFQEEIRRSITLQKFQRFVRESVYVSERAAEIDYRLAETKLNVEYLKFDPQNIPVIVTKPDIDKLLADEAGKKRVKDYFDANAKEFNQAEQVKARHILISFKGARNATAEAAKREKDSARELAVTIEARVKAPGADFVAIAKETTDEAAGKTSGGDLGWFAREAMVKEFSDVAFTQQPGTISGIVESPFGFHIIKLEEKKEAKSIAFETAQTQIAEQILQKEKRPAVAKEQANKILAELKEGKDVSAQLTEFKLIWAETGDVAANASYIPGIGSSKEVIDALTGLSKVGQISAAPVDVRGNLYILRLKSRQQPDMSKLDKEKRRELAQTAAFSEGFAIYRALEKQVTESLESGKKVWMNPEYLALDNPRENSKDGAKPSS